MNAGSDGPKGDGQIRVYNYHLDEYAEIQFRLGEQIIPSARGKINHLLRSRDNDETGSISLELVNLIDELQDHFRADTIEIISAYRSPKLNESLHQQGHQVSPKSLHMKGQALDIHIDEIREETLRDYLISRQLGGVGFYGTLDFVHIDSGPPRQWGEHGLSKRKFVGMLPEDAAYRLLSGQNEYLPGSTLHFTWHGLTASASEQIEDLQLEHFFRGRWQVVAQGSMAMFKNGLLSLTFHESHFKTADGKMRYGRYRWTFKINGIPTLHSSNEFYLKRL